MIQQLDMINCQIVRDSFYYLLLDFLPLRLSVIVAAFFSHNTTKNLPKQSGPQDDVTSKHEALLYLPGRPRAALFPAEKFHQNKSPTLYSEPLLT